MCGGAERDIEGNLCVCGGAKGVWRGKGCVEGQRVCGCRCGRSSVYPLSNYILYIERSSSFGGDLIFKLNLNVTECTIN